jgi:hypothetical protein
MKTTVKNQRRQAVSKGVERICAHRIEWYLEGRGHRLWDTDIEYIQNRLIENFVEGELCSIDTNDKQVCGWWNIQI